MTEEQKNKITPKKILDRSLSAAASRNIRDIGRPALQEIIDEGIRVFERCSVTALGTDEHIGMLFPFLHLLELLDAAEVALDGTSVLGAQLALRAAFEALLALEWISRDPDLRYGAAYVVADIHRRIASHEKFIEGHEANKRLVALMAKDPLAKEIAIPYPENSEERVEGLTRLLKKPHLIRASEEYAATRERMKKRPPFYALWNGPGSAEELAQRLGRGAQYEFLYRSWSDTQHATDLRRQLGSVDGQAAVSAFRNGEGLATAYVFAFTFGLSAIRTPLQFYRPDELNNSYPRWYSLNVRDALDSLASAD